MKSSLRLSLKVSALAFSFLVAAAAPVFAAPLSQTGWQFQQDVEISKPGLIRLALPLDTIDHSAADFRDLRVIGADGQEIPYALIRPTVSAAHWEDAAHFTVSLENGATIVTVRTGRNRIWESVELLSSTPRFMKAANLEASPDGAHWESWSSGLPLFRQDGAQLTVLPLRNLPAPWLRITLEDTNQNRIVVNGVRLRVPDQRDTTFATLPLEVEQTNESATETILNLRLPAANLDLERLEVDVSDELFTRAINLGVRQVEGDEIVERIVGTDTIFRVGPEGANRSEKTSVDLTASPVPGHELILHIDNGDSRPLKIRAIRAVQRRPFIAFEVPTPEKVSLWSGNSQASPTRYDLAKLTTELRGLPEADLKFAPARENPLFQKVDPLAGIALEGSALDVSQWRVQRDVSVQSAGVQTLELDLAALSTLDPSLRDLRLIKDGKQIPFVIERTRTERSVEMNLTRETEPENRRQSLWNIRLPFAHLPLDQLSLKTSTQVFDRIVEVLEMREALNGSKYQAPLGSARWQRALNEPNDVLFIPLQPPTTSALLVRTENGDNPAISIDRAKIYYPITRLLFRAQPSDTVKLLSGNSTATTPHYDIALVANALLQSEKHIATLAAQSTTESSLAEKPLTKSFLLWATLALVVAGLLFVVAKLLPKESGPK